MDFQRQHLLFFLESGFACPGHYLVKHQFKKIYWSSNNSKYDHQKWTAQDLEEELFTKSNLKYSKIAQVGTF